MAVRGESPVGKTDLAVYDTTVDCWVYPKAPSIINLNSMASLARFRSQLWLARCSSNFC